MSIQKIEFTYLDALQINIRGLSEQADGNVLFYSPLVIRYFHEAITCYNNECFFATIALAQASVEHTIVFELNGGNPIQKRAPIELPRNYKGKVDKFVETFPTMKPFQTDIKKLYELYRNTWLHGITGNIDVKKSPNPELAKMGVEEVLCDSGQHRKKLSYQIQIGFSSDGFPDYESTTGKELHLYFASESVAKDSLGIAAKVLKNIRNIYH